MRESYPQRVTLVAKATWPVSTAALPSVNTLEETPMFSERFSCNLEAQTAHKANLSGERKQPSPGDHSYR